MKLKTKLKRQLRKQTTGLKLARNWLIFLALFLIGRRIYVSIPTPIVSPAVHIVEAREEPRPAPRVSESPKKEEVSYSELIEKYARKFSKNKTEEYRLTYLLHCLLKHESYYYLNQNCGDNGKACGPLQFHQETWNRFREQMLKEGLITEIGNRENPEQAIETTAWALTHGKENEWGPIRRRECR